MYALIGKLFIGTLIIQTLVVWVFHFMNDSEKPENPVEWMLWSCLPWVMINFRRDIDDEPEEETEE